MDIENSIQEIKTILLEHSKKFEEIEMHLSEHDKKFEEIETCLSEHNQKFEDIRHTLFILEHEHGTKIDAIFDWISLHTEITNPKFDNVSKLSKKCETNHLQILNHENRISTLEKSLNN